MSRSDTQIYAGHVSMEWLSKYLLGEYTSNAAAVAQKCKNFLIMTSGIDTKSQEDMTKPEREDYIVTEYKRWVKHVKKKFPKAAVLPYLGYTTGNRTTQVSGSHLYRNFQEALGNFITPSMQSGTR